MSTDGGDSRSAHGPTRAVLRTTAACGSGGACTGSQGVGCGGVEVGSLGGGSLLELVQRFGVNRDVEAHLGAVSRMRDLQSLGVVEQVVELGGGDLVVGHGYMMMI